MRVLYRKRRKVALPKLTSTQQAIVLALPVRPGSFDDVEMKSWILDNLPR